MTEATLSHPTFQKERIHSLDILRGFAILGILIMNIQSFAMPGAAYLNPTAYGDLTGVNKWIWIISHVLADQKFMSIFSILFGAGVILFTENSEKRSGKSAGLHYRRTFWLLVIGLIHAHIIWYGDILVAYALCGFLVYLLRKKNPKLLMVLGVLMIAVHTLFYVGIGLSIQNAPAESIAGASDSWNPSQEKIDEEIAAYTGSFQQQFMQRSTEAMFMETMVFLMLFFWRAGGLMLVGMALYKWGVLSAQKSNRFYWEGVIAGLMIGVPIIIIGLTRNFQAGWSVNYSMFIGSQFNYWGSLFIAFAYICLIMIFAKSEVMGWFKVRLATVGQMALTNYLTQSIICTFIFYGFGLSLFGQVDRLGQIMIVIAVWVLQLLWSPLWLKRYRFGPFEWLWRSLTYFKRQEMGK